MARYARANLVGNTGFRDNTPGGWVDTNGPVWWYGSDKAYLNGSPPAGRAAVTKAANLIVNRISAAEWDTSDGDPPPWLTDPTVTRRSGNQQQMGFAARIQPSIFWGSYIRSALLWGMGYIAFERNRWGDPIAGTFELIRPDAVETDPWQAGAVRVVNWRSGAVSTVNSEGRIDGTGKWLWELRNPTTPLDPDTGATPGTLAFHAAELGIIDDQLYYAAAMYGGGGVPSGYLKVNTPSFTQEQADALLGVWNTAHASGTRNTAVLNASTDYQAIAVSPVDAALADMKRLSLQDVANAFGVPGYMIGAPGTSMTYSNVEMEKDAFYEFTLLPWAVAVEETLSALLPGSTRVRVTPAGERSTNGFAGAGAATADRVAAADVPPGRGVRGGDPAGRERDPGTGRAVREDREARPAPDGALPAGGVRRADRPPRPGEAVPGARPGDRPLHVAAGNGRGSAVRGDDLGVAGDPRGGTGAGDAR